jgi:hypothetical protein
VSFNKINAGAHWLHFYILAHSSQLLKQLLAITTEKEQLININIAISM